MAWVHANTDQTKYAGLNEMLVNRGIRDAAHRAAGRCRSTRSSTTARISPNWFEIFEIDDEWMYEPENLGKPGAAPG